MEGKTKWKSLQLPTPRKIKSQKHYYDPGRHERCRLPTISPLNSAIWPVHKTDGSWRMTVYYYKFNQIGTPIAAAIPGVVSLLE